MPKFLQDCVRERLPAKGSNKSLRTKSEVLCLGEVPAHCYVKYRGITLFRVEIEINLGIELVDRFCRS